MSISHFEPKSATAAALGGCWARILLRDEDRGGWQCDASCDGAVAASESRGVGQIEAAPRCYCVEGNFVAGSHELTECCFIKVASASCSALLVAVKAIRKVSNALKDPA